MPRVFYLGRTLLAVLCALHVLESGVTATAGFRSVSLGINGKSHNPIIPYDTVLLRWAAHFSRESIVFWSGVAVLDPKFAQESESGLRTAQSPAGKDENCMQSMTEIYRQSSLASWPAGCWLAGHASQCKSQSN